MSAVYRAHQTLCSLISSLDNAQVVLRLALTTRSLRANSLESAREEIFQLVNTQRSAVYHAH
ncbi:hypothetical protein H6F61_24025 [Cyanobacteria bacterium FACHB-472]|nr:hypothetical protein [Cyanobacteria bacterium FACHB-472]